MFIFTIEFSRVCGIIESRKGKENPPNQRGQKKMKNTKYVYIRELASGYYGVYNNGKAVAIGLNIVEAKALAKKIAENKPIKIVFND